MDALRENVSYIRAKLRNDYVYNGIVEDGYEICTPYYGNALIPRIFREIWFRTGLPRRDIWFNKEILNSTKKIIIVKDPLITGHYLSWLRSHKPEETIILDYENRADNTINPSEAQPYVNELWSYDKDDCKRHGMRFRHYSFKDKGYPQIKEETEYDVLFVGRDKGRAEKLFELQKWMESKGLKVLMYICADRKFQRYKKRFYRRLLDYDEYLELAGRSKAILNIMPEGQTSITQRDLEAIIYDLKEITNNKGIKNFEYYDPARYFILGEDNPDDLEGFMEREASPVSEKDMEKFKDSNVMCEMLKKYL